VSLEHGRTFLVNPTDGSGKTELQSTSLLIEGHAYQGRTFCPLTTQYAIQSFYLY
jgi:hypothetical protein